MSHIDDAVRGLHALDAMAARPGVLAHIDARAKIVTTLVFCVTVVSFDRYTVLALLPMAAYPGLLCALGQIPLRPIAATVLKASPFALMMGLFNPLLETHTLVHWAGGDISAGWVSLGSIMLRFSLTVSAALVLVACTGFYRVCAGLQQLGVPAVFTTQLLLLYRYASVVSAQAQRMHMAHELRAGPGRIPGATTHASLLGHLLLRALERAQRVYQAMTSRGFSGTLRQGPAPPWRLPDLLFVASCCALCALLRYNDVPRTLGHWMRGMLP